MPDLFIGILGGFVVLATALSLVRAKVWWVRVWDFPRSQLAAAGAHARRGPQEGRALGHRQERPPIGRALPLAQGTDRRLVTGQLPVPPRDGRRQPDQRVEPVQRQAHAAQDRPDVVPLPPVRGLVREDVAEPGRVRRRLRPHRAPMSPSSLLASLLDLLEEGVQLLHLLRRERLLPCERTDHRAHAAVIDALEERLRLL